MLEFPGVCFTGMVHHFGKRRRFILGWNPAPSGKLPTSTGAGFPPSTVTQIFMASQPTPPRNKGLVRPYFGKPMVNKPWIRPYQTLVSGGVGGVISFSLLQWETLHEAKKLQAKCPQKPRLELWSSLLCQKDLWPLCTSPYHHLSKSSNKKHNALRSSLGNVSKNWVHMFNHLREILLIHCNHLTLRFPKKNVAEPN